MWQNEIAWKVVEEIISANGGYWPETVDEWQTVAQRFDATVCFHHGLPANEARLIENVLHVPSPGPDLPITDRVYAHELSEAALRWEGTSPYIFQPDRTNAHHDISSRVEVLAKQNMPRRRQKQHL